MDKARTRQEIKNRLIHLDPQARVEKSKQICRNLTSMEEFRKAATVMMYLSTAYEVDTTAAILHCWQQGKTVVVPKVSWQQRHMIPVEINSLEAGIATGTYGLRNPTTGRPMPAEDIDLIVTPLLAFDKKGNRLGRGGGYYDRFLASEGLRAIICGLAFSEQMVDDVPTEAHDVPLEFVVTEDGITAAGN
jgi:5-formyltetrahydrofolate cyclo-ligase